MLKERAGPNVRRVQGFIFSQGSAICWFHFYLFNVGNITVAGLRLRKPLLMALSI